MQKPFSKVMSFDEDTFDLSEHKKAADAVTREKARVKRVRRQLKVGKVILAVIAVIVCLLLSYVAFELFVF